MSSDNTLQYVTIMICNPQIQILIKIITMY